MSRVRGIPAKIQVKLPPWLAECVVTDIENVIRNHQAGDGPYPLHLHDFGKELRAAIKEAEGES